MKLRLSLEPRPTSTWGITLASRLDPSEWNTIRKKVYADANYTCEICGEGGLQLHCHEVWSFDDRRRVQQLLCFKCVCETCHDTIHYGRSLHVYGKTYAAALARHWCKINRKKLADFETHLREVRAKSAKRADRSYVVLAGGMLLT